MRHYDMLHLAQAVRGGGMVKSALISDGIANALGGGLGAQALGMGASFIPGVMSVDSLHNVGRSVREGFSRFGTGDIKGGLISGAKALGYGGLAAVGLLPGAGAAVRGAMSLGKGVSMLGKGFRGSRSLLNTGANMGGNKLRSALGATPRPPLVGSLPKPPAPGQGWGERLTAKEFAFGNKLDRGLQKMGPGGRFVSKHPNITSIGGGIVGMGALERADMGRQQNLDNVGQIGDQFRKLMDSGVSPNPIWQAPQRSSFFSGWN